MVSSLRYSDLIQKHILWPKHAPRSAAMGPHMTQFQNAGLGLGSTPAGDGETQPPPPKEKKKPPLAKQISTKISAGSARLTEVMAWKAKVQDCTSMSSSWIEVTFERVPLNTWLVGSCTATISGLQICWMGFWPSSMPGRHASKMLSPTWRPSMLRHWVSPRKISWTTRHWWKTSTKT